VGSGSRRFLFVTLRIMDKKREVQLGKFLSYILRHKPEDAGIKLDENGWADVKAITKNTHTPMTYGELLHIVEHDSKKRYVMSGYNSKIRANQGHSIQVDVELETIKPPITLYHGTARRNIKAILKKGLIPGSRLHVHLSHEPDTAQTVGERHGEAVVLQIAARQMFLDGFVFYENNRKGNSGRNSEVQGRR
jgi:putative RNA 2'-phosphotransferase